VRAENLVDTPHGQSFSLVLPNGRVTVETALVGRYNISNLLAVAAVLHDAGLPAAEVARRVSELTPPPGRMERVGGNGEPLVVIDYAHTPDALENALQACATWQRPRGGRLVVVFGCGGDRDKGKRPQMGAGRRAPGRPRAGDQRQPAQRVAGAIIDEILAGMRMPRSRVDRAAAIRRAVC
jgi:UDP-N-acetylmuramyl tripeptide synthase